MRVAVAPTATPGNIGRDRPLVVVTPKAGGLRMGRLQAVPRFFLMVKGEIFPQDAVTLPKVADRASPRKRLVRRDRAPLLAPTLLRHTRAATDNRQSSGRDKQSD